MSIERGPIADFVPGGIRQIDLEIRQPNYWDRVKFGVDEEKANTPEKRLRALGNIANNGSQTLTILCMNDNRHGQVWEKYGDINRAMNRKSGGEKVVWDTATRSALQQTLEPIGAAAKSDSEGKDWTLTDFGVQLKAPLIFTWQKLLELGLDGGQVFATNSNVKKDSDGNTIISPPEARRQILAYLIDHPRVRVEDVFQALGQFMTKQPLTSHCINLQTAGLITYESVKVNVSITNYTVSEKGKNTTKWISSESIRGKIGGIIQKASNQITTAYIKEQYKDIYGEDISQRSLEYVLAFCVQNAYIERGTFNSVDYKYSDIVITDTGRKIVAELLKPLKAWAQGDIPGQIQEIQQNLKLNPDYYQDLYQNIAESFREKSPFVNNNKGEKTAKILDAILRNPGKSSTEIAVITGLRVERCRSLVVSLKKAGVIREEPGKGNVKKLFLAEE